MLEMLMTPTRGTYKLLEPTDNIFDYGWEVDDMLYMLFDKETFKSFKMYEDTFVGLNATNIDTTVLTLTGVRMEHYLKMLVVLQKEEFLTLFKKKPAKKDLVAIGAGYLTYGKFASRYYFNKYIFAHVFKETKGDVDKACAEAMTPISLKTVNGGK